MSKKVLSVRGYEREACEGKCSICGIVTKDKCAKCGRFYCSLDHLREGAEEHLMVCGTSRLITEAESIRTTNVAVYYASRLIETGSSVNVIVFNLVRLGTAEACERDSLVDFVVRAMQCSCTAWYDAIIQGFVPAAQNNNDRVPRGFAFVEMMCILCRLIGVHMMHYKVDAAITGSNSGERLLFSERREPKLCELVDAIITINKERMEDGTYLILNRRDAHEVATFILLYCQRRISHDEIRRMAIVIDAAITKFRMCTP